MHSMGLHSALAIKRQRKRREEQKRARDRRFSSQSTESGLGESRSSCASPRNSIGSLDHRPLKSRRINRRRHQHVVPQDKVVSSIGMLHVGVVFLVLGSFLVGSGLIPEDKNEWGKPPKGTWFNELVIAGVTALAIGVFLIILNKIIAQKEEEDLTEYVSRQLTRSKSGHRLVRDVETGCMTTKREASPRKEVAEPFDAFKPEMEGLTPVHFSPTLRSPPPLSASTPRSDLERILEEEFSEKGEEECRAMDRFNKETLSDGTPGSDTRELLSTRYYNRMDM
ncbi:uncharacterized protein LOC111050179 [Nilaparvata lugens]|uniref:uncharacterized protein LOC111050179 n=1 Tax=Nilaparvata lugens TaxID=108931 RepID=UPI000B98816F|nr:uncharacterized protein LOC111050179 [Nilaparvata lugens]XP_039300297.1 uncharacterized protein LOC111050179 [Nilaparvata lugens]XP_039300298.1 uncharacterized protein LOC111050179 [Nilaparvata lugens]